MLKKEIFAVQIRPEEAVDVLLDELLEESSKLILHNDDVNTFDWVIECLVDICKDHPLQAEQCALIVHFKGRCSVKEGTETELLPFKDALLDRGLTATIEH